MRFRTGFLMLMTSMIANTALADVQPPQLTNQPFPLSDVRLLDGPFKQAMKLDADYLLSLDTDKLLAGFRTNAGLPKKADPYGGWESRGLTGHSLGHYLSACSMMVADGDDRFRDRVNYIIDELAECQAKSPVGFIGGMPKGTELFDAIASGAASANGGFDLHGAWVPWYNQHKVFAGVRDAYLLAGNQKAKEVLVRLGDWTIHVCEKLNHDQMQRMLGVEQGGMMETLADIYAITNDPKYLAIAERFWHEAVLNPLADGKDDLTGKHANTQVPKVIGAARLYELTGNDRYRKTAETFWTAVVGNRSFVTGSNSDREHFFPLGIEARQLGPQNGESCNVYNMLKLSSHVAGWNDQAKVYDFYEKALFNHILGSIDPQTGMTTYFQALEPGRFKVYGTPDNSFWCCTGTGMENHAKYGADIYSHRADGSLQVNLFIPSELSWKDKGLTLKQETDFPTSDTTKLTFTLDQPKQIAIRIRVPAWAEQGISVEGATTAQAKAGDGFLTIDRTWNTGDMITVHLPMALHLHQAIDDKNMAAVEYGPIVLAAQLGREKMPKTDNVPDHTSLDRVPLVETPMLVSDAKTVDWLKPVDGEPLHFQTAGVGKPSEVTFAPFYGTHHQRYAVYLPLVSTAEYAEVQKKREAALAVERELAAKTVDEIAFGEQQPEQDHSVVSEGSRTGSHQNRGWRDAPAGGYFSVKLKVDPNRAQTLRLTYWGGDVGRVFDISVNGQKLATQELNAPHPNRFFDVDYALPATLIGAADQITVEFRAHAGSVAGGVFHARVLRN